MSTRSFEDLVRRRERLLMRSGQLRADISLYAQALHPPLALADRARDSVDWLADHPQWPLGGLAALVLLRPRRALRWAGRLWWGYSLFRRGRRLISRL